MERSNLFDRLIGRPAPDFTLPDQHGTPVTLSTFRDRNAVVLVFYVLDNTWG